MLTTKSEKAIYQSMVALCLAYCDALNISFTTTQLYKQRLIKRRVTEITDANVNDKSLPSITNTNKIRACQIVKIALQKILVTK